MLTKIQISKLIKKSNQDRWQNLNPNLAERPVYVPDYVSKFSRETDERTEQSRKTHEKSTE